MHRRTTNERRKLAQLLQKLHNELKSQIDRIISPFGLINAPPNNQQAA
jgi:hypothetical protein